jgi:hypothetical protein
VFGTPEVILRDAYALRAAARGSSGTQPKRLMAASRPTGRWEPRSSRRQDCALEAAGDRIDKLSDCLTAPLARARRPRLPPLRGYVTGHGVVSQ